MADHRRRPVECSTSSAPVPRWRRIRWPSPSDPEASFCAWLALLDDRTSKSFLIAVATQADAPGQVSELSPAESLGRFTKCSLALCLCLGERTDREGAIT